MFINKTHDHTALKGTYLFPYIIGQAREGRFWRPTDSEPLSGDLPENCVPNQLFAVNYRLGFVGAMLKSSHPMIETIEVATTSGIQLDVKIADQYRSRSLHNPDVEERSKTWSRFEEILSHCFGLEVK